MICLKKKSEDSKNLSLGRQSKMALPPSATFKQIQSITGELIQLSLCNDQNFPRLIRGQGNTSEISCSAVSGFSQAMKNRPYREIYEYLDQSRVYNLKMIDGAIIQFGYRFFGDQLISQRLAFFPSPFLDEFQNNSEIYEMDELYADVIFKNIVAFPIRFDYSSDDDIFIPIEHPKAHLTLGQYQNCRIPVSAPLTPSQFIDFILRSFYNTAYKKCPNFSAMHNGYYESTLHELELAVLHLSTPS